MKDYSKRKDTGKPRILSSNDGTWVYDAGLLPDKWIADMCLQYDMITPYIDGQVRDEGRTISYGLSSFGYDARLAQEFLVPNIDWNLDNVIFDPKKPVQNEFIKYNTAELVIPAGGYVLGRTVETFNIPVDVMALCLGKSTYARSGVIINVTPLEPGWRGTVTLEISNASRRPVKVYANEGICQFIFLKGTATPTVSYAVRDGKYQDQKDVQLPKL